MVGGRTKMKEGMERKGNVSRPGCGSGGVDDGGEVVVMEASGLSE